MKTVLSLSVNGTTRDDVIPDNMLLVDYLRENIGLTGTKVGCDGGECGACTVLINDRPRHSCLTLAVTCQGARIETVDGLSRDNRLSALQRGFDEKLGAQCGFCTPGMIIAAKALLKENPDPSLDDIKRGLSGNLCRCTGYTRIFEAVEVAAAEMRGETQEGEAA